MDIALLQQARNEGFSARWKFKVSSLSFLKEKQTVCLKSTLNNIPIMFGFQIVTGKESYLITVNSLCKIKEFTLFY